MNSMIYEMDEKTGKIERKAEYSCEPKQALICYIEQKKGNYNTWEYPKHIDGVRESPTLKNHFYYDSIKKRKIFTSYPC